MKLFKFKDFLIRESVIEFDNILYDDLIEMRNLYPSDSDVRKVIKEIIDRDKNDIESKKLNKDRYIIRPSNDLGKVVVDNNHVKIGKFVKILIPDIKDHILEDFVNKYKSFQEGKYLMNNFEVVNGNDIEDYYNTNNVCDGGEIHSCMVEQRSEVYDLLTKNKKVINLLILKNDDNELMGRALLWKDIDNNFIMDRVYSIDDYVIDLFRMYARKNGWYYRATNAAGNKYLSNPKGERVNDFRPKIKLEYYKFMEGILSYPYLDTFPVLSLTRGMLSNFDIWGEGDSVLYLQGEEGDFSTVRNFIEFIGPILKKVGFLEKYKENIDLFYNYIGFYAFEFIVDKRKYKDYHFEIRRSEILENLDKELNFSFVRHFINDIQPHPNRDISNKIFAYLTSDEVKGENIETIIKNIQKYYDENLLEALIKYYLSKEMNNRRFETIISDKIKEISGERPNLRNIKLTQLTFEYLEPYFYDNDHELVENMENNQRPNVDIDYRSKIILTTFAEEVL